MEVTLFYFVVILSHLLLGVAVERSVGVEHYDTLDIFTAILRTVKNVRHIIFCLRITLREFDILCAAAKRLVLCCELLVVK